MLHLNKSSSERENNLCRYLKTGDPVTFRLIMYDFEKRFIYFALSHDKELYLHSSLDPPAIALIHFLFMDSGS